MVEIKLTQTLGAQSSKTNFGGFCTQNGNKSPKNSDPDFFPYMRTEQCLLFKSLRKWHFEKRGWILTNKYGQNSTMFLKMPFMKNFDW